MDVKIICESCPSVNEHKVFREASFRTDPWVSRILNRNIMPPDIRADDLGT
jgi:hypothetical protein